MEAMLHICPCVSIEREAFCKRHIDWSRTEASDLSVHHCQQRLEACAHTLMRVQVCDINVYLHTKFTIVSHHMSVQSICVLLCQSF